MKHQILGKYPDNTQLVEMKLREQWFTDFLHNLWVVKISEYEFYLEMQDKNSISGDWY